MSSRTGLLRRVIRELEEIALLLEVVDNELRFLFDRKERMEGEPEGVSPSDNRYGGRHDPLPVSYSRVSEDSGDGESQDEELPF